MLTIHLGQDENDCFSAWVSTKEAGLSAGDAADQKGLLCLLEISFFFSTVFACLCFQ